MVPRSAAHLQNTGSDGLAVIARTNRTDSGDIVAKLQEGADKHIRKPGDLDILAATDRRRATHRIPIGQVDRAR